MATPNRVEYLLLKNQLDDFVDSTNVTSTVLKNRLDRLVKESNMTTIEVMAALKNVSIGEHKLMDLLTKLQQQELSTEVEMVIGLVLMVVLILVVLASLMSSYHRKFLLGSTRILLYTRSFFLGLKWSWIDVVRHGLLLGFTVTFSPVLVPVVFACILWETLLKLCCSRSHHEEETGVNKGTKFSRSRDVEFVEMYTLAHDFESEGDIQKSISSSGNSVGFESAYLTWDDVGSPSYQMGTEGVEDYSPFSVFPLLSSGAFNLIPIISADVDDVEVRDGIKEKVETGENVQQSKNFKRNKSWWKGRPGPFMRWFSLADRF